MSAHIGRRHTRPFAIAGANFPYTRTPRIRPLQPSGLITSTLDTHKERTTERPGLDWWSEQHEDIQVIG